MSKKSNKNKKTFSKIIKKMISVFTGFIKMLWVEILKPLYTILCPILALIVLYLLLKKLGLCDANNVCNLPSINGLDKFINLTSKP